MLINLTPHAITIVGTATIAIPPSGMVARVAATTTPAGEHEGCPLVRSSYGEVEGLPAPAPGTVYIVSALVRAAVPHRSDVASPGDLVRDPEGRVIGCRNLVIN